MDSTQEPRSLLEDTQASADIPDEQGEPGREASLDMFDRQHRMLAKVTRKATKLLNLIQISKQDINDLQDQGGSGINADNTSPPAKRQKISREIDLSDISSGNEDDTLSIAASENEFSDEEGQNLLENYDMAPELGVDDILDEYYDQGYKDLVESIDEDLGPNIESQLAEVMKTIWGKAKLSDKHKKLFKKIKVPSNCKFMTTPLLNPEIYNLAYDNVKAKDKAAQRRQRLTVKPLCRS